jgi:hypothetical protein
MENELIRMSILFVIAAGILYGAYTLTKTRSEAILTKWAYENRYQLLEVQPKVFNRGPFIWASKSQIIFRVAVEDAEGIQRSGWVKCGSYWGGIFENKVDVKWDEATTEFPV